MDIRGIFLAVIALLPISVSAGVVKGTIPITVLPPVLSFSPNAAVVSCKAPPGTVLSTISSSGALTGPLGISGDTADFALSSTNTPANLIVGPKGITSTTICSSTLTPYQEVVTATEMPPTLLAAGTYSFYVIQGVNHVGIDINASGEPEAYWPGSTAYPAELFVWDGISQLQKHDCLQPYLADKGGALTCTATPVDTFQVLSVAGGVTIRDLATGAYLMVSGICPLGFSACAKFGAVPTVWQSN